LPDTIIDSDREDTEETAGAMGDKKIVAMVMRDFRRAEKYLANWHRSCVDRYKHYIAPSLDVQIKTSKYFNVPFTTEQIDQFVAGFMEKLYFQGKPCSIYGREKSDKADADAKRDFIEYQDKEDDTYGKLRDAVFSCAMYGLAPARVNYKEVIEVRPISQDVPLMDETGQPQLDMDGNPITTQETVNLPMAVYQGASTEGIDVIDIFFTPEKRQPHDEHPIMTREAVSFDWLKSKDYIIQPNLDEVRQSKPTSTQEFQDYLSERRQATGDDVGGEPLRGQYKYIEWQGYADILGAGKKSLWIIGVVNDILVRLDVSSSDDPAVLEQYKPVFDLGHPNILFGTISKRFGEVKGDSLLDKFHSLQHGMDSLMGMWMRALRQTVNPMWMGDSTLLKTKNVVNDAGTFIDTRGDPKKAVMRVEQEQISRDIYDGMKMMREMGQNASGQEDISLGIAQQGVETLGEASILEAKGALRGKNYLQAFEKSMVEPLYGMRNQINMMYCTDPGYLYSILGEGFINWRTISPIQIRTDVDFICEASTREHQKGVIIQQILQAINIVSSMAGMIGPIPAVKLLEKLYKEGFAWKEDVVAELLPFDIILASMAQNMMMQQGGGQGGGQPPGSMSQPRTEGQARASAQKKESTNVGRVQ